MRVATWNLERVRPGRGARSQRIREAIAAVDPDVWVLTETHTQFTLPDDFVHVASSAAATDRTAEERWVSIWVRNTIRAEERIVAAEPERSAAVQISVPGRRGLIVFGSVLPWRGDRASPLRGAEKFVSSFGAQSKDWHRIASDAGVDLCVAGDLNQELLGAGPVGTKLGGEMLRQVLADQSLTCVTGGRTRDPLLQRGWREGIDHVLVSARLADSARVALVWPDQFPLPSGMPDHHGVCVEF